MFGLRRKQTPGEVAADVLVWPGKLSIDHCRSMLHSDTDVKLIKTWFFESRFLIASGVVRAARIGIAPGARNDDLQEAIFSAFAQGFSRGDVADAAMELLAERTEGYRQHFDGVVEGKSQLFGASACLGALLTKFVTGQETFIIGDFFQTTAGLCLIGKNEPTALELRELQTAHLANVVPLLTLQAFAWTLKSVGATRWQ